jgi:hypothetical protein
LSRALHEKLRLIYRGIFAARRQRESNMESVGLRESLIIKAIALPAELMQGSLRFD